MVWSWRAIFLRGPAMHSRPGTGNGEAKNNRGMVRMVKNITIKRHLL